MDATMNFRRDDDDDVVYYDPAGEIYVGLWCLFAGASVFLALRLWCKITRRHGLWYDDYVLLAAYVRVHACLLVPFVFFLVVVVVDISCSS